MDSPHMYENGAVDASKKSTVNLSKNAVAVKSLPACLYSEENSSDLAELNAPEISLDLHNLIDDSVSEGLFTDIGLLEGKQGSMGKSGPLPSLNSAGFSRPSGPLAYMPQPVHNGAIFSEPVKKEGLEGGDFGNCGQGGNQQTSSSASLTTLPAAHYQTANSSGTSNSGGGNGNYPGSGYTIYTPSSLLGPEALLKAASVSRPSPSNKSKKSLDKHSDEYRRRRERNNIAVRKSREKAKMRSKETEEKVKALNRETERLQKRVELLTKELNVLRSIFSTVGVIPEPFHREIAKHLEAFQQQHQALL